jgi:hypothetical protein
MMHFSAKVPCVTLERRMDLTRLAMARRAGPEPITWSAIFLKAYAVVAARTPLLRTSYMTFPWPRFYEHPTSTAALNVDRDHAGERVVVQAYIPSPDTLSLPEIDLVIRRHQQLPVGEIPSHRRAVRLSRVPWPLRRPVWHLGLNLSGPLRCHFFGTFGITSVGSQGAGITRLVQLLTSQLHYGLFDPNGGVEMRLSFDHRVLDAAAAARALSDLEGVLLNEITRECLARACASPDVPDSETQNQSRAA